MIAPLQQAPSARRSLARARRDGASRLARLSALVVVAVGHLGLLWLMRAQAPTPEPAAPVVAPVFAEIVERPPPPPPPASTRERSEDPAAPAPAATAPAAKPTPPSAPSSLPPRRAPRAAPPPDLESAPAAAMAATTEPDVVLGASAIAGATVAGSGTGGVGAGGDGSGSGSGACDMVRRLQDALREDADIRAAVTRAHQGIGPAGRAILVWNGEWLRSPGQAGKGLAGVRQAISMEVAFAPAECRAQRMRGLVLITLSDRPGGPALALGARDWRWAELLGARR